MRIVSSTPQALSCCTVLLGSNLDKQQTSAHPPPPTEVPQNNKEKKKDVQKSLFEIVGLNAADVVRSGVVEGVHQHLEGLTELPEHTPLGANPAHKAREWGRESSPGSPRSVCALWRLVSLSGRSR